MEGTAARLKLEMNRIIENNDLHRIYIMINFKFMVDCMIILIFMERFLVGFVLLDLYFSV